MAWTVVTRDERDGSEINMMPKPVATQEEAHAIATMLATTTGVTLQMLGPTGYGIVVDSTLTYEPELLEFSKDKTATKIVLKMPHTTSSINVEEVHEATEECAHQDAAVPNVI